MQRPVRAGGGFPSVGQNLSRGPFPRQSAVGLQAGKNRIAVLQTALTARAGGEAQPASAGAEPYQGSRDCNQGDPERCTRDTTSAGPCQWE